MNVPQSSESDDSQSTRPTGEERRKGPADRRVAKVERRNSDRIAADLEPRRDPERPDRRQR